ncbi:hypothetical protein AOLI_G00260070 [Acnodon oligacanthus]
MKDHFRALATFTTCQSCYSPATFGNYSKRRTPRLVRRSPALHVYAMEKPKGMSLANNREKLSSCCLSLPFSKHVDGVISPQIAHVRPAVSEKEVWQAHCSPSHAECQFHP